jgi:dTDP-4-amino-4,6-dideoxygalactose transaminase
MNVPFVDLKAQYLRIKPEIDGAIAHIIDQTSFIGGPAVAQFEAAFAQAYGVRHCIGVANGTDAIYLTLKMLGIGPGDEVITVANSWISTSETISLTGATPVFVDIEPDYYTIDPTGIEKKITAKTKALIPVHLYGQPANMDAIRQICERHSLWLVEDCAQAHFAEYAGQLVGTFGVASTFSFYPGKNLGAYGDAGCILTNDDYLAQRLRMFANHGQLTKHNHQMEGLNSRLDALQAAILSAKLPHIHTWTAERIRHAAAYTERLRGVGDLALQEVREAGRHTFHLYVVRTAKRDELMAFLAENGIQTAIHYPCLLPLLPAYRRLKHGSEDFPVGAAYQSQILSLPLYPELSEEMLDYVCSKIRAFFSEAGPE